MIDELQNEAPTTLNLAGKKGGFAPNRMHISPKLHGLVPH